MYTTNDTTKKGESIYEILNDVSIYYGLTWCHTKSKSAILVNNGTEYFLIKLKGAKVRLLYHQNHNRTYKHETLPCSVEDIDNSIIQQYFHLQNWKDVDCSSLKRTLVYIYHHGNARRDLDSQRMAFLKAAFA